MARTTPSAVADIFHQDADLDSNTDLQPFIAVATAFVDDIEAADASVSDDRLATVEQLVAAHLACLRYPRLSKKEIGPMAETREGESAMGLNATSYGQQAIALDPTGTLATVNAPSVGFDVADGILTE